MRALLLLGGLCAAGLAQAQSAATLGGEVRWHSLGSSAAAASPFGELAARRPQGAVEASLSGSYAAFHGQMVLRAPTVADDEQSRATVTRLYWEEGAWTLGRKAVSWDVGYAFRPLDVVTPEPRRQLVPALATRGTDLIAWQHLGAEDALDLVWANPGQGRGNAARDDEALALRYFTRQGEHDLTAVARVSRRQGAEFGGGLAWVLGDAWELHASALQRTRAERVAVPGSHGEAVSFHATDPNRRETLGRHWRALAGAQYAWDNGWQVLAEAWWDGAARAPGEWRSLNQRAQAVRATTGAPAAARRGELGWMSAALRDESLNRANLLLRASREQGQWRPAIDLHWAPQDAGRAISLSVAWVGDKTRVELGLRRLAGPSGSAFGMLPQREQAWLSVKLAY